MVGVLFAALFAVAPFATVRLPEGAGFIPAVQAVIVLTNRDAPEPYPLALAIAKLYLPDADAGRAAGGAAGPDPRARPLPGNGQ